MKTLYILLFLFCFVSVNHAQFCSGNTVLNECSGEFDDGSGNSEYENNSDCTWLIQVEEDSTILLIFNSFVTESCCDRLKVFNGPNANSQLIGEFRGSTVPSFIQSSSNELFLEFTTDGSVTEEGWSVSYTCNDTSFIDLDYDDPGFPNLIDVNGTNVDYEFELQNNGNLDSGPFEIGFYASEDSQIDFSDVLMFTESIDNLPANSTMTVSGFRDVRDSIPPGAYNSVGFIIDPENEVEELAEGNNIHQETFEELNIPYCDELTTITGCQGTIEDGSGPQNVVEQTLCTWLIESDNNEFIHLDFLNVDLFSSDAIRIYDGEDQNATMIHEFRGDDDFYPVVSSGSSLFFEFDVSFSGDEGWNAEYSCTDENVTNLIMEPSSYVFTTGSMVEFNLRVRNNGNSSSPTTKVYFFGSIDNNFDIGEDFLIDSVELTSISAFDDVQLNHNVDASGILPPGEYHPIAVIDAFDNVVELNEEDNLEIFFNDIDIPYCPDSTVIIDDCEGSFDDASGNNEYGNNSDCTWLVQGPSGSNIRLSFSAFQTESCCDFVHIYDGSNASAPLIGSYSGSAIPLAIQTTQPNAFIEFDTDGSVTESGWEIQYECIQFFSDLQFKDGSTQFQVSSNTIDFATIIENDGVLPTGDFQMGFILSEDEVPNIGDFIIETKDVGSLAPGQEVEDETEINLNGLSDVPSGEYYLIVRLDLGEIIEENDEMDNDFISAFPIDVMTSTEDIFNDVKIKVFVVNQDLIIKNEVQHHLGRISLIQSDGVVLLDQNIDNSHSEHILDVIDYPTGLYFVRIEMEDQVLLKKVFIH